MFTTPGLKIPITSRRFHFSSRFKPQDFCLLCSRDAGKSDLMHDWSDGNRSVIGLVTYSGLFMFVCIIFLSNNTQIKLYSYNNALNIEDRQKLLTNIGSAFQLYRANNCAPLRSQARFARPISRMCASFSHLCRACSEVCNVATCMREILTKIYIYIYIYKSTVGKGKQ